MISENTGVLPVNSGKKQAKQTEKTGEKQAARKINTGKKQVNGGSFVKGQSGNPKGRPKGALNTRTKTLQGFLGGISEALATVTVMGAFFGEDSPLLKLCLEKSLPASKDAAVLFALPPITNVAELAEAQISVMRSVAEGRLTPLEGRNICAIAEKILKTLKERNAESSSCDC